MQTLWLVQYDTVTSLFYRQQRQAYQEKPVFKSKNVDPVRKWN